MRSEIDAFARGCLVDENPNWAEEALAGAPLNERTWAVSGNEEPALKAEGIFYRVENLEKVDEKHILPFLQARAVLSKLVGTVRRGVLQGKKSLCRRKQRGYRRFPEKPDRSPVDPIGRRSSARSFKLRAKRTSNSENFTGELDERTSVYDAP